MVLPLMAFKGSRQAMELRQGGDYVEKQCVLVVMMTEIANAIAINLRNEG